MSDSKANEVHAPGRPGVPPRWAPSSKDGVGMALGGAVWFTIGQGAVEEVFYPGPDLPQIAGFSLILADDAGLVSDEKIAATHHVERPEDAVPLYLLRNTCRDVIYVV